ncbi:MAG: type II secretion system protein [Planctomycetota bacterium]
MQTHLRRRSPGFTLIELLVVIGIIAVLVGILLPVLAKVRGAGKATVCMSNMRSMAQATIAYSLDHDRNFPQPATETGLPTADQQPAIWFNALDYYLGQTVTDGSKADRNYNPFKQDPVWNDLPGTFPTASSTADLEPDDVRTIKMNQYFGHMSVGGVDSTPTHGRNQGQNVGYYRSTDMPEPSATIVYADGRGHDTQGNGGRVDVTGSSFFALRAAYIAIRHEGGANLTKVDGSVEHQVNPVSVSGVGYESWYDKYADATFTQEDRALWPDITFNFRPESFGLERRYAID